MADFDFRDQLPDSLKTKRLILRAPSHADVDAMARLANNTKIHQMLSRLPHPYARENAIDFIDNIARTAEEHAYSILSKDETFIGVIGVIGLHLLPGELPELGYWLGEPYWGEGYASEATAAILSAADTAGCATIRARAITENKASIAVLLKSGFVKTDEGIDDCGVHKGVSVTQFRRERLR